MCAESPVAQLFNLEVEGTFAVIGADSGVAVHLRPKINEGTVVEADPACAAGLQDDSMRDGWQEARQLHCS